jgi:hypothetical protein
MNMPNWFEHIPTLRLVESYFNSNEAGERDVRLRAAIERLAAGWGDGGIDLDDTLVGVPKDEIRHFKTDWLGARGEGSWPNLSGDHVREKLRSGLLGAFSAALDTGLPLTIYWTCANDDRTSQTFECGYKVSPAQVTVIIATPNPNAEGGGWGGSAAAAGTTPG